MGFARPETNSLVVGIVGLGLESKNTYIPVLKERASFEIVGIDCLPVTDFDFPVYSNLKEALSKHDLELLVLCANPVHHLDLIKHSQKLRISTLCEKPIYAGNGELPRLCQMFLNSGRFLQLVENWKYSWQFSELLRLSKKYLVDASSELFFDFEIVRPFTKTNMWRIDKRFGGRVWEYGWHAVYLAKEIAESLDKTSKLTRQSWIVQDSFFSDVFQSFVIRFENILVRVSICEAHERRTTLRCGRFPFNIVADDTGVLVFYFNKTETQTICAHARTLSDSLARRTWLSAMLDDDFGGPLRCWETCITGDLCCRVLNSVIPVGKGAKE